MASTSPKRKPRLVAVMIRMFGETTRSEVDVEAFVDCVVQAGQKHLGVREQVRIETTGPAGPTTKA